MELISSALRPAGAVSSMGSSVPGCQPKETFVKGNLGGFVFHDGF